MGLFGNKELEKKVSDLELTKKLTKGKHVKELSEKERKVARLTSRVELLEQKLKDSQEETYYYKSLDNDREQIIKDKKALAADKEDLDEEVKLYVRRTERLEKREKRLTEEENDEYKKGYSDGLADGLRKAHDITREDRKYMTMIAMSTNQSEAIKTSVKALEGGFNATNSKS